MAKPTTPIQRLKWKFVIPQGHLSRLLNEGLKSVSVEADRGGPIGKSPKSNMEQHIDSPSLESGTCKSRVQWRMEKNNLPHFKANNNQPTIHLSIFSILSVYVMGGMKVLQANFRMPAVPTQIWVHWEYVHNRCSQTTFNKRILWSWFE